jgi:hypothetical protein
VVIRSASMALSAAAASNLAAQTKRPSTSAIASSDRTPIVW